MPHEERRPVTRTPPADFPTAAPSLTATADNLAGFAAGLAANDLAVLPLLPRTKRPRWRGGYKAATCNPVVVAEHWRAHPSDNIGIRPPPGMAVIDIDPRNGGDTAWAQMIAEHGALPRTWTARTGSGGLHLWFVVEPPLDEIRAHLAPGVDVKHGGNGFVVAPPSRHPNGGVYQWVSAPFGMPAPAPVWLVELLRSPVQMPPPRPAIAARNGGGEYSLRCLARRIEAAPVGRRHDTVRGAFLDAARQGDLDEFLPTLTDVAIAAEQTQAEIDAIIRWAREKGGRR